MAKISFVFVSTTLLAEGAKAKTHSMNYSEFLVNTSDDEMKTYVAQLRLPRHSPVLEEEHFQTPN